MQNNTVPTWDELLASMNTVTQHPSDTAWAIYRYLNANLETLSSQEARTLLASYMKIPLQRPSLLHSCILGVAVKMTERYADFRFPQFLTAWGYDRNLRAEDRQKQTGKDGRTYLSLQERTERAAKSYALHHAEQRQDVAAVISEGQEISGITPMIATKMYETERNGRRMKSVKLIAGDGKELLADSHQFKCKPWEIVGNVFDVLTRTSAEGNMRVAEIAASQKPVSELFPPVVGYVDRFDSQHQHYHIFDSLSRHFVAEAPKLRPNVGNYVMFSPVIPAQDKFKSAIIINGISLDEGRKAFGIYDAVVKYVNTEKGYFYYQITSAIPSTPEGTITQEGSAQLSLLNGAPLNVGQPLRLIMFLKRGKDGTKRNAVVEIL